MNIEDIRSKKILIELDNHDVLTFSDYKKKLNKYVFLTVFGLLCIILSVVFVIVPYLFKGVLYVVANVPLFISSFY